MLREGTWLVRHTCSNTQISTQFAGLVLVFRASTRPLPTAHRFTAFGRPSAFSSIAEQEEAVFDIIDGRVDSFGSLLSSTLPSHATGSSQKFPHHCHLRKERQPTLHLKANDSTQPLNQGSSGVKSRIVPSAPVVRLDTHCEYRFPNSLNLSQLSYFNHFSQLTST